MKKVRQHLKPNAQQTGTGGHPGRSGSPTGNPIRYPNGDVQCRGWGDRINFPVCVVRSFRQPEKCKGCPLNP